MRSVVRVVRRPRVKVVKRAVLVKKVIKSRQARRNSKKKKSNAPTSKTVSTTTMRPKGMGRSLLQNHAEGYSESVNLLN